MHALKEQALLLGPRKSLVGVIAEPAPPPGIDRPTVVILNSGIVHRVGANRMSVAVARALASAGFSAVRFDLSGIGDSDPRPDAMAPLEAALADVREALDALAASRPARRFILAGLCSGADHSLIYAQGDPRVVGAVLLDPTLPRTLRHRAYHYRGRLTNVESWLNVVRGKNPLLRTLKSRATEVISGGPAEPRPKSAQDPEVRAYLANAYRTALDRGAQFFVALTGERSYYREQLLEAFPGVPFGDHLRLEYFKDSDHMFSARSDSARLIRELVDWAQSTSFAGAALPDNPEPAIADRRCS